MKFTGFVLLSGGWIIVLAAVALLPSGPSRVSFVLVALGVQLLGLALLVRAHLISSRESR